MIDYNKTLREIRDACYSDNPAESKIAIVIFLVKEALKNSGEEG